MRFGGLYSSRMKGVMACSARKILKRWWRVLALKPACQRRGGIVISVLEGVRRLSVSLRDVVAELSQTVRGLAMA